MNNNENKYLDALHIASEGHSVDHNASLGLDMTVEEMEKICAKIGVDTDKYAALIQEMYWDGFCALEIQQQIEVLEGDCSL